MFHYKLGGHHGQELFEKTFLPIYIGVIHVSLRPADPAGELRLGLRGGLVQPASGSSGTIPGNVL